MYFLLQYIFLNWLHISWNIYLLFWSFVRSKNERQTALRERSPPFAVVRRRSLMIKILKKRLSLSKNRTFCLNSCRHRFFEQNFLFKTKINHRFFKFLFIGERWLTVAKGGGWLFAVRNGSLWLKFKIYFCFKIKVFARKICVCSNLGKRSLFCSKISIF